MNKPGQRRLCCVLIASIALAELAAPAFGQSIPPLDSALQNPIASRNGVVVAEEKIAAQVGADILAEGGNAVDAAVATAFALAVTFPRAGNIGGGGFMMVHLEETDTTIAIDYRETAPAGATRDMYLGPDGAVDEGAVLRSHEAAGVPGTVAGLLHAQEKYGRLPRKTVMAPAIKLASKGYELDYFKAAMLDGFRDLLTANDAAKRAFYDDDGASHSPGATVTRTDLAKTLKLIAKNGRDGFYRGPVADRIADDMAANGGLITRDDLAAYEVTERDPLIGTYRGFEIRAMPPPSSGGVHIIQMLNMLEIRNERNFQDAEGRHYLAETMRRAFADRSVHLGDPDFIATPTTGLTAKNYARALTGSIDTATATPSSKIKAGDPAAFEGPDTTHISVIDADGNMVANTYTLNLSFGSGIVVPGTGILLNNEMDDFAAAPGVPNAYGLIGGEKNAIAPGKRPLSSMSPTFLFKDGDPYVAIGAPGGARIITSVFQAIVNIIDGEMNLAEAIAAPRIHHQWTPDTLFIEPGVSDDTQTLLRAKGHNIETLDWFARVQGAMIDDGWIFGANDTRMPGGGACTPDTEC